jgi:PadR family transcriptional regulator AphA
MLVLLDDSPGSGYDLVQRFRFGIGHFWNATHQQIYQELKKLHAERLVQYELHSQEERPDKKVYCVTAAGRRGLAAWFAEPVKPPQARDALLVKLYGGTRRNLPALIVELEQHLALHQKQLGDYRNLEALYFSQDDAGRREHRLPYLTLRRGIRYQEGIVAWLEETIALLRDDALPSAPVPSARAKAAARPRKR